MVPGTLGPWVGLAQIDHVARVATRILRSVQLTRNGCSLVSPAVLRGSDLLPRLQLQHQRLHLHRRQRQSVRPLSTRPQEVSSAEKKQLVLSSAHTRDVPLGLLSTCSIPYPLLATCVMVSKLSSLYHRYYTSNIYAYTDRGRPLS